MVKKWKGKDWFDILAPKELGGSILSQTPTTDPKIILGRKIEVGVPEILNDRTKYYMKLKFRVIRIEGKSAETTFNGFECIREHLLRIVRKGNQKVETILTTNTKDGWLIKIKSLVVLNGNTTTTIQKNVRLFIENYLKDEANKNIMNELLRKVMTTETQMVIKRRGSRIYPIRFSEIARIKVLRSPEEPVKAKEEKPEEEAKEKPEEKPEEVEEEKPKEEKPKKKLEKPKVGKKEIKKKAGKKK